MSARSDQPDYSTTYDVAPHWWDEGVSVLAKLAFADGSQACVASGWHRRQIVFENHGVDFAEVDGFGVHTIDRPTPGSLADLWGSVTGFEVEIALDDDHAGEAEEFLAHLLAPSVAADMVGSMAQMITRVSANRANVAIRDEDGAAILTLDLLCQNLPARSGNASEPLRAISRWCRVFHVEGRGTVTIYQPLTAVEKNKLRWPHNAVWLNRGSSYYTEKTTVGQLADAVSAPIKYELYNLENWRIEFEFWENQPFQVMVTDDANVASERLAEALKELAVLSEFVTVAFLSSRNLETRIARNQLLARHEDVRSMAEAEHRRMRSLVIEYRTLLETASQLLANTAQSVQAVANRETAEAAEKTNTFLNFATAVFFIPTLIISFYSMSIIGQTKGDPVPTSFTVLALCVASVAVGVLGLWGYRAHQKRAKRRAKLTRKWEVSQ